MGENKLAYWNLRGLGEPLRYLLHYKNVTFEDKRYVPDGSWEKEKFTLGLDFPNLPYFIDEKVKLSQSTTILRYLAKKYDLEGKSESDKLRVSLAEQEIIDLRGNLFRLCYNPNFATEKEEYLKNIPQKLKLLSSFLGDHKFMVGDYVTYVDFLAFDALDFHTLLSKTILDGNPNLKAYLERVRNLPGLRDYLQSSTNVKWPIVGPKATWGGSGDMPK